jgi:hypothetical protein
MQTTNRGVERRRLLRLLIDISLPLDLLPADAVCFVPVQLSLAYSASLKPDNSNSFQLPPTATSVQPSRASSRILLPTAIVLDPGQDDGQVLRALGPDDLVRPWEIDAQNLPVQKEQAPNA